MRWLRYAAGGLFALLMMQFVAPALASDGEESLGDDAPSTSLAISHWKNACREGTGSLSACAKLGGAYFTGYDGMAPNIGEALHYETYGCSGGLASACSDIASMYHKLGRFSEARASYQTACEMGDSGGCRNLGVMMATGQGGSVDYAGSKAMAAKACGMGESDMCEMASSPAPSGYDDYHAGFARAEAQDMPGMISLMKTSCFKGNYYDACDVIARWSVEGSQWPKDLILARDALRQACVLDHAKGCARYAAMLERGEGGDQDAALAYVLYERACDAGEGDGCFGKARIMYEGRLGFVDMKLVTALLKQSCRDHGWEGCVLLAKILRYGEGSVAADPQYARDLYGIDCNNRRSESCVAYADMLMKGELGGPTLEQIGYARERYRQACTNNIAAGCAALEAMGE